MEKDYVMVENTYDKDGYWIKSKANDIPLFIPEQEHPMIQIMDSDLRDCEWFITRKTMTKKEFESSGYYKLFKQ